MDVEETECRGLRVASLYTVGRRGEFALGEDLYGEETSIYSGPSLEPC